MPQKRRVSLKISQSRRGQPAMDLLYYNKEFIAHETAKTSQPLEPIRVCFNKLCQQCDNIL